MHRHQGEYVLADSKMASLMTEVMDVDIMAVAQGLGINIYVYHKWGKEYKWLKFPCINGVTPKPTRECAWTTTMVIEKVAIFIMSWLHK